jgi:hypothetical protein
LEGLLLLLLLMMMMMTLQLLHPKQGALLCARS